MLVVTRFAPSPTGDLHIGGVRTALFNWLFAKVHNGKFLLRIEDTDQSRSNDKSLTTIIDGLSWMHINWDKEIVHQSNNVDYHRSIAYDLLERKLAYKCYLTPEELTEIRESNDHKQLRKYRDHINDLDLPYVIRFKMPLNGKIVMNDLVQGPIKIDCEQLEDFVLLRQDGNPTYQLACAADDYKMNVTHIIRGDDHITNAFKQIAIYQALEWTLPYYSHIPLIHNDIGKKLSKRNQDSGISFYRDMGILPEAMLNYLLRLGWSHGDDEIISVDQAIKWFNLENIGKSAAQLNMDKLLHINSVYLRNKDDAELYSLLCNGMKLDIDSIQCDMVKKSISSLKVRANTMNELKCMVQDFFGDKLPEYHISTPEISTEIQSFLKNWIPSELENEFREELKKHNIKLKDVAPFIRFALSGRKISPGIFDMIKFLGTELSKYRLDYALRHAVKL
ncbi:glutamate--tRNA ligase [Candidatus Cytomitobacter primus]|uniref:Glutamate--tRNA ligase n=1 Tax=Candidatus Cytomitobacter primus TaxID=2066024 RepID=A0A5C0UF45_9PROT|nr:glutamate--tRNA ligase [Candidatus Cytomitobacter primus]QEK38337.1 glutamate--tRNA ligase [Candidatus Cytomitobacter primus]